MKHDLTTGTWQDDTGCPISIVLAAASDVILYLDGGDNVCGFVFVIVGVISGGGRGHVHLVDHLTEIHIPLSYA